MSEVAVRVEGLGKRYRIGAFAERHDTLRDTIAHVARAPMRNLRKLRGLSTFSGDEGEDILWALRDISFEVRHGEALGIIGRNGAGKSTLLKVLSRITEPTEGRAVVTGRVGSLLEVGTGFHQELTGRENVYLNGSILGMDRAYIDRMFDQIVDFAGVERFIDTPVKRYSSGMKVRLAFSVAAHLEPDILVIDEVLAVGDAEFQRKCLGKMDEVAGEGRTVLFVSHDMDAITRLCTRALLLDGGRLVAEGDAPAMVHRYLNGVSGAESSAAWTGRDGAGRGVELRSVRVLDSAGELAPTVTVDDEIRLELTYAVDRPGLSFRCGANFFTQGVSAFTTIEPEETERPLPGVYRSRVIVPPHLLTEGHYSMNVVVFATKGGKIPHVNKKNVVTIHVTDPARGDSARGDYAGTMQGVVRPRLDWQVGRVAEREVEAEVG
jgi:lipopolysaccharide transport system ATP-binding protein